MPKLSWERFEQSDDGYFHEPLTLREDVDAGAATHLARRREREQIVAYLRSVANSDTYRDYGTREERMTLLWVAEDIEEGKHYAH